MKMSANYHTHTIYCDGESTPVQVVESAIGKGFSAIGFSGHGYTHFDTSYCMQDTDGYIREINALKEKYSQQIEIYCGVEEDAFSPVNNRESLDYIIGSAHYILVDGEYLTVDLDCDGFEECMKAFDYDAARLAHAYYRPFVEYILRRKPDIVGHFDLITKFDEIGEQYFLNNPEYLKIAEEYINQAAQADVLFEVNTGAISRKYRKTPYPCESLLHALKKNRSKLILSSDSHSAETLDFYFAQTEQLLRDVGFGCVYELHGGKFEKRYL